MNDCSITYIFEYNLTSFRKSWMVLFLLTVSSNYLFDNTFFTLDQNLHTLAVDVLL